MIYPPIRRDFSLTLALSRKERGLLIRKKLPLLKVQEEASTKIPSSHLPVKRILLSFCRSWHLDTNQVAEASQGRSLSLSG
jgi:hypothetical protein